MRGASVGFVAVQTDVTYLSGGNQRESALHHAETGSHDRYESDLSAADDLGVGKREGSFDLNFLQRKVAGSLVAHEHRDLLNQLAELLGTGVLVPQQGYLVLNQRVVANDNVTHITFPPAS